MWQDSIQDNVDENKLLFGTGYKDKFNVFKVNNTGFGNDRRGLDQLNEQVHNYFMTVLLRGGIIQLLIVIFIFYNILTSSLIKDDKASFIVFTLSILFISSFDSSMENSHFPLLFYYFIGNFYLTKKHPKLIFENEKAFITGITGQDGYYLTKFLIENNYEVHGIIRRSSTFNTSRIDELISKYSG